MKTINIAFVDFWEQWDENNNFIIEHLQKYYNVQLSDKPDYVFYSNFGGQIQHFKYNNCIKIFYTPENLCPDFNLADYAISFEHLDFGDRHLRYPNYMTKQSYKNAWEAMKVKHLIEERQAINRKFCSFVFSNGNADKIRDTFFEKLSQYKRVDSGGKHKNNIGNPKGVSDKRKFDSEHKFSITFENTSHPGYLTEKLVEGFAASVIPIYWGDPQVGQMFNKKSFININDFSSIDEAIDFIIKVDNDDQLYMKMLHEQALNDDTIWELYEQRLDSFLLNIFEQPHVQAFRRNREFWGKIYTEKQKIGCCFYENICNNKCARGIKKILKKLK